MWHKAEWMGRPVRLELTRVGWLVKLANRYTTKGALQRPQIENTHIGKSGDQQTRANSITLWYRSSGFELQFTFGLKLLGEAWTPLFPFVTLLNSKTNILLGIETEANLSPRISKQFYGFKFVIIIIIIIKISDLSWGWPGGSLFNNYYTEVLRRVLLHSIGCSTLPWIPTLKCWVLCKAALSTIF